MDEAAEFSPRRIFGRIKSEKFSCTERGKKMSNLTTTKKQKHMSFDDRLEIQTCLDHGMTFKAIAKRVGKDQTTISKEVKKHIVVNPNTQLTVTDEAGTPITKQPCPQLLSAPEDKTAAETAGKVRSLKERMSGDNIRFGDVLPLLLTDNGGEFANISAFISDVDGEIETSLFFCDPAKPSQKPRVEKNHTIFRDIVPKGESFDHFTQETVNLIFSHVNSMKRKSLNGKSPYEIFTFTYGEYISSILGVSYVPDNDVIQSPKLLHNS